MSIKVPTKYIVFIVLGVIIGTFILGGYLGHRRTQNALNAIISGKNDTLVSYRVKIGIIEQTAYEREQIVDSQRDAIQKGILEREALRKLHLKTVNELTKAKMTVDFVRDSVKHTGQIIHIDTVTVDGKQKNAIILPFEFKEEDKYINLTGNFDDNGKLNINLKVPVEIDLYTGIQKKTKRPIAIATSDNPYVSVIDIKSYKFDKPKVKRWGIGVHLGYGINTRNPMQPSIILGVGISYNLIRF